MGRTLKSLTESENRSLNKLPDWQLGWLAGMMDGEGSISIDKNGQPRAFIVSTTPIGEILQWMTGMGTIDIAEYEDRKTIYRWRVCSVGTVHKLLSVLYPYLLIKKRHCEVVIKYCEERLAEPSGYYDSPIDKASYIAQIRELNK